MSDPIRLDKHVAAVFGCSRGEAQQYIEGGWVSVDGVVVEEPQAPITGQQVSLAADAVLGQAEPATLLLNKPSASEKRNTTISTMVRLVTKPLQASTPSTIFSKIFFMLPIDFCMQRNGPDVKAV